MRHPARLAVAACLLAAILTLSDGGRAAAAPPAAVTYAPPVPGPVVDDWRPPAEKWGAGNRGVDFGASRGDDVVAAADGEVVFAGPVAGSLHVVVLHADGLRTSYSFLAGIAVRRGDRVAAGQVVGTAGGPVHFGVRAGDDYLDPLTLLGNGPPHVHLIEDDDRRRATVAEERSALERFVRTSGRLAGRVSTTAAAWARDRAAARGQLAIDHMRLLGEHAPPVLAARLAHAVVLARTRPCTPAGAPLPARPPGRRILVRVAGFNSSTNPQGDAGAIADLDARALGYPPGDVLQFSYAGGTTTERPYRRQDTWRPLRESGARLAALLQRVADDNPGVPIDIVAHSQGGLVTRAALATTGERRVPVGNVVTLATPHHGADLATLLQTIRSTRAGPLLLAGLGTFDPAGIDPRAPALRDLAEHSDFIRWLDTTSVPPSTHVTSIAARRDVVVPVPRAQLEGATNVVVDPGAANQHDALPGSAPAARAVALALSGAPPPCESWVDALADAATGEAVSLAEDAIGVGAAPAMR